MEVRCDRSQNGEGSRLHLKGKSKYVHLNRTPASGSEYVHPNCAPVSGSEYVHPNRAPVKGHVRRAALFVLLALLVRGTFAQSAIGTAPVPADCSIGTASADLLSRNARSRVYSTGSIAYGNGAEAEYVIPRESGVSPLYVANIWVGGMVGGELRTAAATYNNFEFWPGPLDEHGEPASGDNCSEYDRIWSVSRLDIKNYEETGDATTDLSEWPAALGAPVMADPNNGIDDDVDGLVDEGSDGVDNDDDGIIDETDEQELRDDGQYDLEAGDRPFLIGDEAAWWIMNDAGNEHNHTRTPPIGMEIRVHAFAFHNDGHIGNATFYKYELTKQGAAPLEDAYVSMWSDPDLGYAGDDYVGVDTTLGLGYVYNAKEIDSRYGTPPALGFDFLRGPKSKSGDTAPLASFMYFISGGPIGAEPPYLGHEIYNAQQGRWRRGEPITEGGLGYQTEGDTTTFMNAGDPVTGSYWSDVNADREGSRIAGSDRRMVLSAGPFSVQPGEKQEIVVGILWARGLNHLDSVSELREASRELQAFVDRGYEPRHPASPPTAPALMAPADGAPGQPTNVSIRWMHADGAVDYELQVATTPEFSAAAVHRTYESNHTLSADPGVTYYWRVRGSNAGGYGPWSSASQFSTSEIEMRASGPLRLASGEPAFVEHSGPSGADPCSRDAESPDGCEEIGANAIYGSVNSTGDYYTSHPYDSNGNLEESVARYAPHTFEIRFTEKGSYGMALDRGDIWHVPFEVWDLGPLAPNEVNDESDDVQLVATPTGSCPFTYGDEPSDPLERGWSGTDRIYALYPATTYQAWAAFAEEQLAGENCNLEVATDTTFSYLDVERLWPISRLVIYGNPEGPNYREEGPAEGTVLRFYSRAGTPPVLASPVDGANGLPQPISFWWNSFENAGAFHLQLDNETTFSTPLIDADTLSEPPFRADGLAEGSYVWRVRAENPAGGWTAWSEPWSFTAAAVVATERGDELPTSVVLASNYPNPFNPTTTLRYGLPGAGNARIEVFDLLGRRVAVLLDRTMPAGWHRLEWNATNLSSGTYFVRLTVSGNSDVRQVLLLR